MKKVDEKISMFLYNIIEYYFDLEETLTSVFDGVSLDEFCKLKAEFDSAHENEEDE